MSWLSPLAETVTHHWARTGKAYNLARAKPELKNLGIPIEEHLDGRKLKDAIQEDGATELRLIRDPENRLTWGLIPHNVEIPFNIAELFAWDKGEDQSGSGIEPTHRFSRGVWLAFAKPLKPGARRFLEIKRPSAFLHEVPEGHALPSSGLEVLPEFIWDPDAELLPMNRNQGIIENIKRWATEKGIKLEDLTRQEDLETSTRTSQADYMDISKLSQADKARILIPLDLVEKIRFGN